MTRNRRGFTLIEILVVTVLGALVVGAALQVLITNRRAYTAQTATISGQQSTRMAVEVLFAELREVSASGGDIIAMSGDSIRVRLMRKFSIVCDTDFTITDPTITVLDTLRTASGLVLQAGANRFDAGDSVFIWADNDPDIDTDDVWISAEIADVDTTTVCPQDGAGATDLEFSSLLAVFLADSVGIGAPVRSYEYFTFGTTTMNGDVYLARRRGGGDMIPVTGPLQPSSGLDLVYLDSLGVVTSTPTDVNQIRVTVRTGSTVLGPLGQMVQDSISVLIFTRG